MVKRGLLVGLTLAVAASSPPAPVGASEWMPPAKHLQDDRGQLRIAVTEPAYDDIGSILDSMGWTYTELTMADLANASILGQYDVVFINCAYAFTYDGASYADASASTLEQYVRDGGAVYASDWAYEFIDRSFPGYIQYYTLAGATVGEAQVVQADIVNPGLASYLAATTIEINFDMPSWVPIQSVTDDVRIYLAGDYSFNTPSLTAADDDPLTVSFAYGDGRVVYTAFHSEGQDSEDEARLLEYVVYISATEGLSSSLRDLLAGSGYATREEILGAIDMGQTSPRYALANPTETDLFIGLNWQMGTMRLSVFRPDGSLFDQQEGASPLALEIADAGAGEWSYQADALDVPLDNTPYLIQIGIPEAAPPTPTSSPQTQPVPTPSTDTSTVPSNGSDRSPALPSFSLGVGLCLCALLTVGLAAGAVILLKRRRARPA